MIYKAVIFDLDGTLVHTMPEYRYKIVGQTLKDFGIKAYNEDIDSFWFESGRNKIIKNSFGIDPKLFWRRYHHYDDPELRKRLSRAYEDVDFIHELRMHGIKTGIVTGAPVRVASLEIDIIGKENFDGIVFARQSNGIRPKPDPHGIEECLNHLTVQKDETVYVGNSDEDLMTAKNAQVFDVLLFRGEHKFPETQSSLTIYSLYELRELLGL